MNELKVPFKGHYTEEAAQQRLDWVQQITQQNYVNLPAKNIQAASLQGRIENFVGGVEVPIGLAGPITIQGKFAKGKFIVPIATTQGTLIASICRGAKAIQLAGNVTVMALGQKMMRSPFFQFENLGQAIGLNLLRCGLQSNSSARETS